VGRETGTVSIITPPFVATRVGSYTVDIRDGRVRRAQGSSSRGRDGLSAGARQRRTAPLDGYSGGTASGLWRADGHTRDIGPAGGDAHATDADSDDRIHAASSCDVSRTTPQ
jgi:hypothetical protein